MNRAEEIMARQEVMASKRANFENHWQEVAEVVAPEYARFTLTTSEGQKQNDRIFDNTAYRSLTIYQSVLNTMLTPRNRMWHHMRAKDDGLSEDLEVSKWLEGVNKTIYRTRYSPYSNFASQVDNIYLLDGLIGNACLYVDWEAGKGLRYRSIYPREIYIDTNHQGIVNRLHRKFVLKGAQVAGMFGGVELPENISKPSNGDKEFTFIHCVKENGDYDPGSLNKDRMRWASTYICEEEKCVIKTGGYTSMPYIYVRHAVAPHETYGRGPAMRMLPTIKMMNEKQRTIIRGAQMAVSPPLLLSGAAQTQPFSVRPFALNFDYMTEDGRELVKPLNTGVRPDIGLDLLELDKKSIESEFFVNLYNILVETPEMTATEVMQRVREKAELLTPTIGRKQSEFLGNLLEREIDLLSVHAGLLDGIPEQLDDLDFEYDTEMTRNMQADEGTGILRTLESAIQVAAADPTVMDVFNMSETVRELAKINGVPAKLMRSVEEVQAIEADRQEQQQMMAQAEAAKNAAPMAKVAMEAGAV